MRLSHAFTAALLTATVALTTPREAAAQHADAGMDAAVDAGRRDAGRDTGTDVVTARDAARDARARDTGTDVVDRDVMSAPGLCPNVLVVLDNSGSMSALAGDSGLSKWQSAVDALVALVPATAAHTRYGLSLFPCPHCATDCSQPTLAEAIAVEPGNSTASAITGALDAAVRRNSTPTAQYLATSLMDPALNDATRVSFVLLITDGAPTCADTMGNSAANATLASITALRALGVKTFVIGFDANVNATALNNFALAGGEPLPATSPHRYYDATDEASLRAAFDAISTSLTQELGPVLCDESCYAQGCATSGQVCVSGACVADPCAGVTCASNQACTDGTCHDVCPTGCPTGQMCADGACIADPCASLSCAGCVEGVCPTAGCLEGDGGVRTCGVGRVCRGDDCVDNPCLNVHCPSPLVCDRGGCVGVAARPVDAGMDSAAGTTDAHTGEGDTGTGTGTHAGSGCSCRATGARMGGRGGLAALLLALGAVRRRRRRGH